MSQKLLSMGICHLTPNAIELSPKSLIFIVLSYTEYKTYACLLISFSVQNVYRGEQH